MKKKGKEREKKGGNRMRLFSEYDINRFDAEFDIYSELDIAVRSPNGKKKLRKKKENELGTREKNSHLWRQTGTKK